LCYSSSASRFTAGASEFFFSRNIRHDQPVRHARLELRTWVSPAGTLIAAWWSAAWLTAVGVEHLPAGFY
jgi:hypothetical protein